MNHRTHSLFPVIAAFILLIAGCSSSELTDVWSDPYAPDVPFRKVLVISGDKDHSQRRMWEDAFCREFGKHQLEAVPSYRLFPGAVPDTEQVIAVVNSDSFDGVLITHRRPTETNRRVVRGYTTTEQIVRYDRRRAAFISYYGEIYRGSTLVHERTFVNAIDVWSVKNDGVMIWSAASRTEEAQMTQPYRLDVAELVMDQLMQRGIISSRR